MADIDFSIFMKMDTEVGGDLVRVVAEVGRGEFGTRVARLKVLKAVRVRGLIVRWKKILETYSARDVDGLITLLGMGEDVMVNPGKIVKLITETLPSAPRGEV